MSLEQEEAVDRELHEAFKAGADRSVIRELSKKRSRARRTIGSKSGIYATGIAEVDAALENMPRSLQAKGARKGTRAAAKVAMEFALRLVPVLTGDLEKSLKIRAMKRSRRADRKYDVGHTILTGDGFFTGEQYYAGFVEYGTGPRQTSSGAYRGQIGTNQFSFLRPAIYTDTSAKLAAYTAEVKAWLRTINSASAVAEKIPD